MADQKELITLRKREFGEVIGDSFKVFFKNFKNFALGFLIFVMPIFLLSAIAVTILGGDALKSVVSGDSSSLLDGDIVGFLAGFGIFYIGLLVCYVFIYCVVYSGIKAYRQNGDEKFEFGELKNNFFKYIIPVGVAYLFILFTIMGGSILIGGLGVAIHPVFGGFLVVLLLPLIFYFSIICSLMPFIRVEEDAGLMESFHRSRYLVKDNWWSVFGVYLVASLIASVISSIFSIPYYIFIFMSALSGIDNGGEGIEKIGMTMAIYFLISILGSMFTSMYAQVAISLKYYDLVENKDNVNLNEKIDSLGNTNESFFENEGEY